MGVAPGDQVTLAALDEPSAPETTVELGRR
jgi:hypothetical protein